MIQQRSKEWFEARKGRVTASLVGAILGLDPNMTRDQAMRLMVREWHGAEREFKGNIATEWGVANEKEALIDFTMQTGIDVEDASFHAFSTWAGASPDGFTGSGNIVEIKCPYSLRNEKKPIFKNISEQPHYYAQVQFQLFVTGAPLCHFFQWAPRGSRHDVVYPCDAWRSENLPKLMRFHAEFMDERDNPAHLEPLRITLDCSQTRKLLDEYDTLTDQENFVKERKAEILESLVEMANGKNAIVHGRNLTYVERQGSISYSKVVKDLMPDADLEQYRDKPSGGWRLY